MLWDTSLLLIVFVITVKISAVVYHAWASPLKDIPNAHWTVPFSRFWLLHKKWRKCENRTRLKLHSRWGPVIRLGPREVGIDCIDHGVESVYRREFDKDVWYTTAFRGDDAPYMFTMIGQQQHAERKKMLSHSYSRVNITTSLLLAEQISRVVADFREQLEVAMTTKHSIEMFSRAKSCMMHITSAWLYGPENGTNFLRQSEVADRFYAAFAQNGGLFFWRSEFHGLYKLLGRLRVFGAARKAASARSVVQQWSNNLYNTAQQTRPRGEISLVDTEPTIHSVMASQMQDTPKHVSARPKGTAIATELLDHLVASHDVGGITLTYAMHELSLRPDIQRALSKELRNLQSLRGNCTTDFDSLRQLPHLHAVWLETLRLRSPNPGPWPRIVPTSGCSVSAGYKLPAGTVVSATSWTLHRNPELFPSPEKWRPERWLEADNEKLHEMKRWFWAFGSGTRKCIGVHFAERVIKSILACVYADFETQIVDDRGMEQFDGAIAGPVGGLLRLRICAVSA